MTAILKLFHPYIPFVTENLWQYFNEVSGSTEKNKNMLISASWINTNELQIENDVEQSVQTIMSLIRELREARQILDILPKNKVKLNLSLFDKNKVALYNELSNVFETCAAAFPISVDAQIVETTTGFLPLSFTDGFCYLKIPDNVDLQVIKSSLEKKLAETQKLLAKAENSLQNEDYVAKAPANIVEETKANVILFKETVNKLNGYLKAL
jgi:valyl-tRNA synthetase